MMNTPYDVHDGPDDIPVCPICGSENVDWIDCPECGGWGVLDDLADDDPALTVPDRWEEGQCVICRGAGGWWQCYEGDRHPAATEVTP